MTVTSLCLGIDISPRRLGWALAHLEDGTPVACGCEAIDLPDHGWDRGRIGAALASAVAPELVRSVEVWSEPIYDPYTGYSSRRGLGGSVECEIHYVAIERPALPPKSGTNAAFNAGRAYQEVMSAVRRRWPWAVVDEMQPSEWRKLAGLAGNASKAEVFALANELSWFLSTDHVAQDAADASLIAVAGVERNRATLSTPSGQAAQ